jgi:putative membrane protein
LKEDSALRPDGRAPFRQNRRLQAVAVGFGAVWLWAAIQPRYPFDWLLENLLVFAAVGWLIGSYRRHAFSDLAYGLIATFLAVHAIGSHYTYSEVPLGFWLRDGLALDRNHYDRLVHGAFGLLIAYPAWQLVRVRIGLADPLARWLAFFGMVSASAIYEMIEWLVAIVVSPEAAYAFLGTQGDPFDAQKDAAAALAGAFVVLMAIPRRS